VVTVAFLDSFALRSLPFDRPRVCAGSQLRTPTRCAALPAPLQSEMPKALAERTTAAAKARRPHAPKSRAVKLVQLHDALRRQLLHEPADALKSCQRGANASVLTRLTPTVLRRPSEAQRGRALNRTVAPDDALARATRLQLLITLERYRDALSVLATGELPVPQPAGSQPSSEPLPPGDPLNHPLETSYCLYKLDRFAEARSAIEGARDSAMDPDALDRGLLLLEAQIVRVMLRASLRP